MNKQEMITKVAELNELTKVEAKKYVESMISVIVEELTEGNEVNLSGFGKFSVAEVKERSGIVQMGDNKGSTYTTPAHKAPKFKFGKNVKTLVAGE